MNRAMRWGGAALVAGATSVWAGCGSETLTPHVGDDQTVDLPGSWTIAASLPEPVVAGAAVAVGNRIYVVGGDVDGQSEASAKTFRYDAGSNSWERLADLPEGLRTPGIGVLDGAVLVVGGNLHSDQLSPRANVWRYDDASDTWAHHSTLPLPSTGPHVASTSEGLLAAGLGSLTLPPGDSTAFLARGSSAWSYAAPAPVAAGWAAAHGAEAWIAGLSGHARFDASTRSWATAQSLPTNGSIFGAWAVDGRKHMVTRIGTTASHWVLESGAAGWTSAEPSVAHRLRFDAMSAAIGETLYLIGGFFDGARTSRVDVFSGY